MGWQQFEHMVQALTQAATGGAIGSGVTAALLDLDPSEVQAEALKALLGVLGHLVTPSNT